MLSVKTSPVGVDIPVQGLQIFLYNQLKAKWNITDTEFESYGRSYRNKTDKGYIPEVFQSSSQPGNTVYKPVEFDETVNKALFFFDAYDDVKYSKGTSSVKVDIIFLVNVALLKPLLAHRGDEEIRNDVERLMAQKRFSFTMTGYATGFKNVFNRFDGLMSKEQVTFKDLHPIHVFKITADLIYNINDC